MTVGIGLVGCGSIGQIHAVGLAQLAEEGELRAVVAVDPSSDARSAANRNCRFAESSRELDAAVSHPEVDAVVVAGPTVTHPAAVRAVIGAGKAVLCEKPLATDFPRSSGWSGRCGLRSGGPGRIPFAVQPACSSGWRELVAQRGARRAARAMSSARTSSGRPGRSWPVTRRGAPIPCQAGGGALLEHTIHGCDLLVHLFGPAASVSARTRSVFGFGVEDIAAAQVEHDGGVIGTITTVFNGVVGREERRLEVFFEQATVECTGDFIIGAPEDSLAIHRPGAPAQNARISPSSGGRSSSGRGRARRTCSSTSTWPTGRSCGPWASGRPASPDFTDAWRAHALVDAAYRSAGDGRRRRRPCPTSPRRPRHPAGGRTGADERGADVGERETER